jgi:hypothetical protein
MLYCANTYSDELSWFTTFAQLEGVIAIQNAKGEMKKGRKWRSNELERAGTCGILNGNWCEACRASAASKRAIIGYRLSAIGYRLSAM